MAVSTAQIESALLDALQPQWVRVSDDSHRHAGHAGAREGGHYGVAICSTRFEGLGRVARHRLVYDALAALMGNGIHALAIEASTPSEDGTDPGH